MTTAGAIETATVFVTAYAKACSPALMANKVVLAEVVEQLSADLANVSPSDIRPMQQRIMDILIKNYPDSLINSLFA